MKKTTIGITGSTGVLGTILTKKLNDFGYTICAFKGDISKKEDVENWVKSNSFDIIFHLAALVPINSVNNNLLEAYSINVGGTLNLANALKKANKKYWVFYASTCHVYKSSDNTITETDTIEPINNYGLTKRVGENILEAYSKQSGSKLCIGRIFSFFHNTQRKPFLFPSINERMSSHDMTTPFVLEGANNVRDFLDAEDVVDIMIELMNKKVDDVVNIASGKGITIKDFVLKYINPNVNIVTTLHTPNYLVANINKLNLFLHND